MIIFLDDETWTNRGAPELGSLSNDLPVCILAPELLKKKRSINRASSGEGGRGFFSPFTVHIMFIRGLFACLQLGDGGWLFGFEIP